MTTRRLAGSKAGRIRGVNPLTGVGFPGADELVATRCHRAGVVGVFLKRQGSWRLVGPALPPALAAFGADGLGIESATAGVCALVQLTRDLSTEVVVASARGSGLSWRLAAALLFTGPDNMVSPVRQASRLFVSSFGPATVERLEVLNATDMPWTRLPVPPRGASTVVFGPSGRWTRLARTPPRAPTGGLPSGQGAGTGLRSFTGAVRALGLSEVVAGLRAWPRPWARRGDPVPGIGERSHLAAVT